MNKSIIYKAKEDKDIQEDLRKLQALQKEPCEDCISRQAVIDTLDRMDKVLDEDRTVEMYRDLLKECYTVLPSKIGHWIIVDATHSKCDRCWAVFEITSPNGEVNYCPNCGAKMVEPMESEE